MLKILLSRFTQNFSLQSDWKAWDGETENLKDAIVVGETTYDRNVYIGRVAHNGQLIPGTLYTKEAPRGKNPESGVYFAYDDNENYASADQEIFYLAKDSRCDYEWIQGEGYKIPPNAVSYYTGNKYVVGRYGGAGLNVGYLKADRNLELGLIYANHGRQHFVSEPGYEILVCNIK